MDYEAMSTPDLQQECRRRGLPTGRSKSELVQRLTEADAAAGGAPASEDGQVAAETADPNDAPTADPDVVDEMPEPHTGAPAGDAPTVPNAPAHEGHVSLRAFRCRFPAGPEGPDDEAHLAYRQTTIRAAVEAGLTPRGDAYRTGTVDGYEVYEVRVRQVT